MSRHYNIKISRVPTIIKAHVLQSFARYNYMLIFGPLGFLKFKFIKTTPVDVRFGKLRVAGVAPLFQTYLTLLDNMLRSVLSGHSTHLELRGVGYKFRIARNTLYLILGFSHVEKLNIPNNIRVVLPNNKNLILRSYRQCLLNDTVTRIKNLKADPIYKNKGIFFKWQVVQLKIGKKSAAF